MDLATSWNKIEGLARTYLLPMAIDLALGMLVFFAGRWLARVVVRAVSGLMQKSGFDVSLRKFLCDVMYAVLLVAVVTASLDQIGVRTTAVVAVLGAAGLAVGLALQGSLSNFAAGVMLIVLRPYKVHDMVTIGKYTGSVEAIKVFHTILVTADNRQVTIPNGQIITGTIENVSVLGRRRVDIVVTVAHGTDLGHVKQWLEGIVVADPRVFSEPVAAIELAEVGADSVKLYIRPWTNVEDYGSVATDTVGRIKDTFEAHGVKFTAALQLAAA